MVTLYPEFFMRTFLPTLLPLLWACSSEEGVKIYNSDPTATITSHTDGEIFFEAVEYTFIGQVSDENHSNTNLKVVWSTDTQELCPESTPDVNGETSCLATLNPSDTKLKLQVTDPEGAAFLTNIAIDVQETDAPTINLISPTADGSYYSDQLIHFSAIIQDAEDAPEDLRYTWESSQDGELALSSSATSDGTISGYLTLTEGQHAVSLRVEDTSGKSSLTDLAITVGGPNNEPQCSITSPESGSGFVFGQNTSFSGTATDEDINNALLTVSWESNIDGVFETSAPITDGSLAFTTDVLSIGNHSITLKVEDEVGGLCTDAVQIAIGTPPTLTITSPTSGEVITVGESIAFAGTVEDEEDIPSDINISWVSDIDGEFSTQNSDSSGNIAFGFSDLSSGLHNLVITATDSDGLTAIIAQSLRVNTPPSAPTLNIAPDPAFSTDDLIVTANGATDADGDAITYTYEWYTDGTLTGYTTNTIPASATSIGEQWYVRVTSNDGYTDGGFTEIATYIINSEPTISAINIAPSTSIYNDSVLTCSATASDADETVTPTYEWFVGSNTYSGATLDLSSTSAMPTDTITCTASVEDSNGASTSSSENVVIENRSPSVSGLAFSPTLVYSNTEISCTGTTSDDDGETPTTTVEWTVGSNNIGSGDTITLDSSIVSVGDTLTCTLIAEDDFGGTASDIVSTTILNTEPTIDSVSLTPTEPNKHATLLCEASTSDVDGDTPTLSFAWRNLTTGDVYASTSTTTDSVTLDLSSLTTITLGDVVECAVTSTDFEGAAITQNQSVEIINSAPIFDMAASISPSTSIYTNTALTCTSTVTDSDDGVLTPSYEWFNGTISLGTGDAYTISETETNVGDTITCIATAIDSDGETTTSSVSEIILNSAPTISGETITSNSSDIYNDSTLTCSSTHSDIDEPTVSLIPTYTWSSQYGVIDTGPSLDLGTTSLLPEDIVYCTIDLTDSEGDATQSSISTEIVNRAPSTPTVTISWLGNGTLPIEGQDDLTCIASGSIDADNETVSYLYSWTSSAGDSVSGDTVPSTSTTKDEIWTCLVEATDGRESVTTSESIMIQSECSACGNGQDGSFEPQTDIDLPGGTYNYTDFIIPVGVRVTVTGTQPLVIYATNSIQIHGELFANGGGAASIIQYNSVTGYAGSGVAGGTDGTMGRWQRENRTNGVNGEHPVDHLVCSFVDPSLLSGGTGGTGGINGVKYGVIVTYCGYGFPGGNGGGGGGAIALFSLSVDISGTISIKGGNGSMHCVRGGIGGAGTVWIHAGDLTITGTIERGNSFNETYQDLRFDAHNYNVLYSDYESCTPVGVPVP